MGRGERGATNEMDEYDRKFAEMQKYIPFLEAMIERLQNVKDKSREVQLQKMQSLHGILSNSKRKLKIETLQRCEDVLQKLHNKVEKGNTSGLNFPNKKSDENSSQSISTTTDNNSGAKHKGRSKVDPKSTISEKVNETPASPSPPVSPDSDSRIPIIIPTERYDDKTDSKPASPDQIDTVPTKKPIIIPTERTDGIPSPTSDTFSSKNEEELSFNEWDMLEECDKTNMNNKNRQTSVHGSSPLSKVNEGRNHVSTSSRHLTTVPVPSLDGSRRLSSVLEKNRQLGTNVDTASSESKSSDTEHILQKHKTTPPRLKDPHNLAKTSKTSASLLLSPPPVSTEPPLSMEDLAELLSDSSGKQDKKNEQLAEAARFNQDAIKSQSNLNANDSKPCKPFLLTQDEIDRENDRRWEEVDKHIVKLTTRKCMPHGMVAPMNNKMEGLRLNEGKGMMSQMNTKHHTTSPGSDIEPRYADNYERRPRLSRDYGVHDMIDKSMPYGHLLDEDTGNPIPTHFGSNKPEERSALYQRRQGNSGPDMVSSRLDSEFRVDGQDYYNRQGPNAGHWSHNHPPLNSNEFCNNQWQSTSNYGGIPNSSMQPAPYSHPMGMHQDTWNVNGPGNPVHMDPHVMNDLPHRPNQFTSNLNPNHVPRGDPVRDEMSNSPVLKPLMSPTNFPIGSQYRNFSGESRSYEPSFERGMEYSHMRSSWESSNRVNEINFREDLPCGMVGGDIPNTVGPGGYSRTNAPPWSRDRDRCNRGRGRDPYYNDRSRNEMRTSFNREIRRTEWPRENHSEWDSNRFNRDPRGMLERDPRGISERDPRVRSDHNVQIHSPPHSRENNITSPRDPRLAKDKHILSPSATMKSKEPIFSDRSPKKRQPVSPQASSPRKSKDKSPKSPKSSEHNKKQESESNSKSVSEKSVKDKVQSPLETLYGVIDTKAKTVQGSLHNFKIPKIKRVERPQSPTSSQGEKDDKDKDRSAKVHTDDTTVEVSSSSDGNLLDEDWNRDAGGLSIEKDDTKVESTPSNSIQDVSRGVADVSESSCIGTSTLEDLPKDIDTNDKNEAQSEEPKSKDEVTQQWIEALIRKSFEFGEGKKLVEQAKLIQKIGEALETKNLKKIKKIIESESESSSSERLESLESKKIRTRKKRRVIVSDSSDDECLASRLGILNSKMVEPKIEEDEKSTDNTNVEKVSLEECSFSSVTKVKDEKELFTPEPSNDSREIDPTAEVELKEKAKPEPNTEEAQCSDTQISDDKETIPKPSKPKAKRRNSLEMLQEDIREMFICDEVVTATGFRMCRLQKENQNTATSPISTLNPSVPQVTKKEETSTDVEDTIPAPKHKKSTKTRSNEESSKPKSKGKVGAQRVTRQRVKQILQSSDSEEDQPLALRTENIQSTGALSTEEDTRDESQSDTLRRSKRVIQKEMLKEPRIIVEKADLSKFECARVMFDSSSDESFGIDVSELAAAVDNSLHSEKQSDPDTSQLNESVEKKESTNATKKSSSKKDSELLVDDNSVNILTENTEGSSLTPTKEPNLNEELLSNILVGLAPVKTDTSKAPAVDKGSDADVEEDISEPPVESSIKKSTVRKKKKKCNWQLGILSKKKKKRVSAPSPKTDLEANSSTSNIEKPDVKMESSSEVFNPDDDTEKIEPIPDVKSDPIDSKRKLEKDVKDNDPIDKKIPDVKPKIDEFPASDSPVEMKQEPPTSELPNTAKDSKEYDEPQEDKSEALDQVQLSEEDLQYQSMKDMGATYWALRKFTLEQWTDYVLTGKDRYTCYFCFFTGKNIVHHYKLSHPGKEILISRLRKTDAQLAIEEAERESDENLSDTSSVEQVYKFNCRICSFTSEGMKAAAVEAFYEHCTTHTGEYRFRCNSCPYQAVAKSSTRTHYYKVCRKYSGSFNETVTEAPIPDGDRVYGYLCSLCNFVQLVRQNVERHVKFWHSDSTDVKIIKINMSADKPKQDEIVEISDGNGEPPVINVEKVSGVSSTEDVTETPSEAPIETLTEAVAEPPAEVTSEAPALATVKAAIDAPTEVIDITETTIDANNKETPSKALNVAEELEKPIEKNKNDGDDTMMQDKNDDNEKSASKKQRKIQLDDALEKSADEGSKTAIELDADVSLNTSNLSAFVCPPELEDKDAEIERERKKKMQEIIENIGIKLNNYALAKGTSIIDKLQDKMRTDVQTGNSPFEDSSTIPTDMLETDADVLAQSCTNSGGIGNSDNCEISILEADSTQSDSIITVDAKSAPTEGKTVTSISEKSTESQLNSEFSSEVVTVLNQPETKVRDPLATVGDNKKSYESEMETSDLENMRDSGLTYDSDSSTEISDGELPADVRSLLNETSNINVASNDTMMTTIQRLAAQLKATKSPVGFSKTTDTVQTKNSADALSALRRIPDPPNVIPITSIRGLLEKIEGKNKESIQEAKNSSNGPKNFIRLRRLSGDLLSATGDQENVERQQNGDQQTKSEKPATVQSDTDEECSFLKIENVVSLAPAAENTGTESPIITDIRKAVETSPLKSGVSVLKKSHCPLILKRINTVTITQPIGKNVQGVQPATSDGVKFIPIKPMTHTLPNVSATSRGASFVPIAPKSKLITVDGTKLMLPCTRTVTLAPSQSSSALSYKVVKVVRTPTILKRKQPSNQPIGLKLKSSEAYTAMVKPAKLSHFYKCSASDCSFTTDYLFAYQKHYQQHEADREKKTIGSSSNDFRRCAYCGTVVADWNQMKEHLEEKHAHCRYQCHYCFYRAVSLYYIQIHQELTHPGYQGVILGKMIKEVPLNEEIRRHDYVHPYVCQHECGKIFYVPAAFAAHLKSKHVTLFSNLKCHICSVKCSAPEKLLEHYRAHNYCTFQCLYCLYGTEKYEDMQIHLATLHFNRLPQLLERSLPRQAVRDKDVIEQLIVKSLDENMRVSGEIIEIAGSDKYNISKEFPTQNRSPPHKLVVSQLPKEITAIDKEESESTTKTLQNSYSSPESASATLKTNVSPETSLLLRTVPGKGINNSRSVSDSENLESVSEEKPAEIVPTEQFTKHIILPTSGTLIRSLGYAEEFININLLDNPEILKNVNNHSNNASDITSTVDNSKAEDSDIEILETIEKNDDKPSDNNDTSSNTKEIATTVNNTPLNEIKDLLTDSSSNENSNMSNDGNISSRSQSKQPLTLDDIKDTGFTGEQLYRCGYQSCDYGAPCPSALRLHAIECSARSESMNCVHCNKRFVKIGFLLDHLKLHGLKRFGCALCKLRCTVSYQAMAHMRTKHKVTNSKLVPADPKNPSADGLFIVQPLSSTGERRRKKRKNAKSSEKESEKMVEVEKLSFSPDEIDLLPRQAIYNREVQCAVCPYTTKVRTNIVRHLQLHAKDQSVPESGPVNPVPCLDKKERMFDKMVNLASSSHQNGRMGGKPKEATKDDDRMIPKFVPEHKRYVCGVAECNYLTVDEAMLRYHLKALHSDELYFRCLHCPQPTPGQESLNIAIDKMGVHLKMHDTRLYKCSHCNHHHYHRHVVERHLTDKHPEKRPFVKVVRELEANSESNQQQSSAQDEVEEEVPDPDGNHWKCNMCEYKCVYKAEMIAHATTIHDEKCQYKCTICPVKTSGKIPFEQHVISKHKNDPNVDYIMVFQRIKGVNKKNIENPEQTAQEEPFDTTPLWRRDMPRVRHIRGILLEEDEGVATDSSAKGLKRKSDTEMTSVKPAKIKPGKSFDDPKQSKLKTKRSSSGEKATNDTESFNKPYDTVKKNETDSGESKTSKGESSETLALNDAGAFGPYGSPDGNMYVCTLCTQFKTKYKHDMRDHLYRELNYSRWHCKACGYLSVNRNSLLKHFAKHHQGEQPEHEPLSPDQTIEDWVYTLLKIQTCIMKNMPPKQILGLASHTSVTADVSSTEGAKTSNVKALISSGQSVKSVDKKSANPEICIDLDENNDNIGDNATLVIDTKENSSKVEKLDVEEVPVTSKNETEKPLTCKHCKMIFTRWRGFKLHVQLTHLKRLGFVCPYCDRSTNSETLMRQHVRSKHPGCVEKIITNPAAGGPELSKEFWEKEYGIVFPKRSRKKRKMEVAVESTITENEDTNTRQEKCTECGFQAINFTGLKAHMRIHGIKHNLKCSLCNFSTPIRTELIYHWRINHPTTPFKLDASSIPGASTSAPATQTDNKITLDDYSDDIEEEQVIPVSSTRKELLYGCFYCNLRSKSLDAIKTHWSTMHKETNLANDPIKGKVNLPFRYKEFEIPVAQKIAKTTIFPKRDVDSSNDFYNLAQSNELSITEVSGSKQEGWVCQWCNELCDSEANVKTHQNLFHSHLPLNFKRQGGKDSPNGYLCPECPFTTTLINLMKHHVPKHINLFKCKYCDKTFSTTTHLSLHSVEKHPDLEVKVESIQNYDTLVENMMARVTWSMSDEVSAKIADHERAISSSIKNRNVARKSTGKQTMRIPPIPCKIKAVARKSTNSLPRHMMAMKSNNYDVKVEEIPQSRSFSYYGLPQSPVDLTKLNTYMVVGGHRMKVKCITLAQLININPKVLINDIKHDEKYASLLSNSQ